MIWHLQLFVDLVAQGLASDAILNVIFAVLVLWGGFGERPKLCALLTAAVHVLLLMV